MKHVYMIAPSYRPLPGSVEMTRAYFENQGFKVTIPEDLLGDDLLCANQDAVRMAHLKEALEDDTVNYIWAIAGGYGMTRLMPQLLTLKRPEKPKIFIGFSDGTALHIFLNQFWGWPSLHGFVAAHALLNKVLAENVVETFALLENNLKPSLPLQIRPMNAASQALESLLGKVVGGNLCLVECSLGTPWQLDTQDKILFLEEVDERGYRIDRMLTHLSQAELFDRVRAVLLGDFMDGAEPDGSSKVWPVLENFTAALKVPVFRLKGYGHDLQNRPLPFNVDLDFEMYF